MRTFILLTVSALAVAVTVVLQAPEQEPAPAQTRVSSIIDVPVADALDAGLALHAQVQFELDLTEDLLAPGEGRPVAPAESSTVAGMESAAAEPVASWSEFTEYELIRDARITPEPARIKVRPRSIVRSGPVFPRSAVFNLRGSPGAISAGGHSIQLSAPAARGAVAPVDSQAAPDAESGHAIARIHLEYHAIRNGYGEGATPRVINPFQPPLFSRPAGFPPARPVFISIRFLPGQAIACAHAARSRQPDTAIGVAV